MDQEAHEGHDHQHHGAEGVDQVGPVDAEGRRPRLAVNRRLSGSGGIQLHSVSTRVWSGAPWAATTAAHRDQEGKQDGAARDVADERGRRPVGIGRAAAMPMVAPVAMARALTVATPLREHTDADDEVEKEPEEREERDEVEELHEGIETAGS